MTTPTVLCDYNTGANLRRQLKSCQNMFKGVGHALARAS